MWGRRVGGGGGSRSLCVCVGMGRGSVAVRMVGGVRVVRCDTGITLCIRDTVISVNARILVLVVRE